MAPLPAALFYWGGTDYMRMEQLRRTWGPVIAALVLLAGLLILPTGYEGALTYQNADRVRAEVLETDESSIIDTGLIRSGEQRCTVRLLGGLFEGQTVTAINRLDGSLAQDKIFAPRRHRLRGGQPQWGPDFHRDHDGPLPAGQGGSAGRGVFAAAGGICRSHRSAGQCCPLW